MKNDYKHRYGIQRCHAIKRGIEWCFTFETWLEWWGDDIANRGRGSGKLVMARYNDTGPYHPNNVRKATHNENSKEVKQGRAVFTEGLTFDSLTKASEHFNITVEAVRYRIKTRPEEYYYL